jgi:hypothetical protein
LKISIKTKSPQAHLEVCVLIQYHGSIILDHSIRKGNGYGFFVIDTPKESVDSFILVENSVVDLKPLVK